MTPSINQTVDQLTAWTKRERPVEPPSTPVMAADRETPDEVQAKVAVNVLP
jgi:hypothetical protein